MKRSLGSCGEDVFIGRGSILDGAENVYIGNDVWIGANAHFMSSDSNILIKKKALLAPKVTVVTGDHRDLHSFPTRRSSDLLRIRTGMFRIWS